MYKKSIIKSVKSVLEGKYRPAYISHSVFYNAGFNTAEEMLRDMHIQDEDIKIEWINHALLDYDINEVAELYAEAVGSVDVSDIDSAGGDWDLVFEGVVGALREMQSDEDVVDLALSIGKVELFKEFKRNLG